LGGEKEKKTSVNNSLELGSIHLDLFMLKWSCHWLCKQQVCFISLYYYFFFPYSFWSHTRCL